MSNQELSTAELSVHPHRRHWDARYRASYQPRPPSALLQRWLARLPPGDALDVACGAGRNTVLLAAYGWRVVGVDVSPVGLRIARAAAAERNLKVDLVAADVGEWSLPTAHFNLICVFRFLDRSLCPRLERALRPGGVLLYETFTVAQQQLAGGPQTAALLLQPGELPQLFPTLDVLEYSEGVVAEDGQPRALAGFVGRRAHEAFPTPQA